MEATKEGLRFRGHVDQLTDEGEQAWSQIKSNTAIDLLEVSFTSTPIHPSARVLSWKSMAGPDCDSMNTEELREHSLGVVAGILAAENRELPVRGRDPPLAASA